MSSVARVGVVVDIKASSMQSRNRLRGRDNPNPIRAAQSIESEGIDSYGKRKCERGDAWADRQSMSAS